MENSWGMSLLLPSEDLDLIFQKVTVVHSGCGIESLHCSSRKVSQSQSIRHFCPECTFLYLWAPECAFEPDPTTPQVMGQCRLLFLQFSASFFCKIVYPQDLDLAQFVGCAKGIFAKAEWPRRVAPVWLRFVHCTVRAIPVFGSDGLSGKGFLCVSNESSRAWFWFRFRFLKIGLDSSSSVFSS